MARYRKLDLRTWNDLKFRELTPLPPSGQSLWLYLILGPQTTNIPGLFEASEVAMADRLGWSLEAFREAFQEAFAKGMAKADWKARLVWLPKAPDYNYPESPNVVKSWGTTFDELPECLLKWEAYQSLKAFSKGLNKAFEEAFDEAFAKALPNQEQEQEQDLDKKPLPLGKGLNGAHSRIGRKPREVRAESLRTWIRICEVIDWTRKGSGLTWHDTQRELSNDAAHQVVERIGGYSVIANRTQFTQGELKRRFRETYEQLLERKGTEDSETASAPQPGAA